MASTPEPRIAPGGRREIGRLNAGIVRLAGLATRGDPPHLFTTLARHRKLFRRWLWFAGALMPRGKLPRRDTELVILRVAHNAGSEYEWGHHERIGRRAGLSQAEIARVREGPAADGWAPRDAMLLEAVDSLRADGDIGDELWSRLSVELDEVQLIELCMLAGHYEMLAKTLATLRVVPDHPVGGGGG
jgi:alkylhydroperoxidase family enzyme